MSPPQHSPPTGQALSSHPCSICRGRHHKEQFGSRVATAAACPVPRVVGSGHRIPRHDNRQHDKHEGTGTGPKPDITQHLSLLQAWVLLVGQRVQIYPRCVPFPPPSLQPSPRQYFDGCVYIIWRLTVRQDESSFSGPPGWQGARPYSPSLSPTLVEVKIVPSLQPLQQQQNLPPGTMTCRYYARGICKKAGKCGFVHGGLPHLFHGLIVGTFGGGPNDWNQDGSSPPNLLQPRLPRKVVLHYSPSPPPSPTLVDPQNLESLQHLQQLQKKENPLPQSLQQKHKTRDSDDDNDTMLFRWVHS